MLENSRKCLLNHEQLQCPLYMDNHNTFTCSHFKWSTLWTPQWPTVRVPLWDEIVQGIPRCYCSEVQIRGTFPFLPQRYIFWAVNNIPLHIIKRHKHFINFDSASISKKIISRLCFLWATDTRPIMQKAFEYFTFERMDKVFHVFFLIR